MHRLFASINKRQRGALHHSRHCHRGFTLLELLAVMTLVGMMASIAVPRMLLAVDALSAGAEERTLVEIVAQVKIHAFLRHVPQHLAFHDQSIYREALRTTIAKFTHLRFIQQQITWNANGFSNVRSLEYTLRGQKKKLLLE